MTLKPMRTPGPVEMMDRVGALPAAAHLIARLGDRPGIYLVGGAVRDLLLEREPLDLDIVVEGDAIQLARELGGEIRAYGRFGTGTVRWQGYTYDLATARREVYAAARRAARRRARGHRGGSVAGATSPSTRWPSRSPDAPPGP